MVIGKVVVAQIIVHTMTAILETLPAVIPVKLTTALRQPKITRAPARHP